MPREHLKPESLLGTQFFHFIFGGFGFFWRQVGEHIQDEVGYFGQSSFEMFVGAHWSQNTVPLNKQRRLRLSAFSGSECEEKAPACFVRNDTSRGSVE
jgi:hypothetical protein